MRWRRTVDIFFCWAVVLCYGVAIVFLLALSLSEIEHIGIAPKGCLTHDQFSFSELESDKMSRKKSVTLQVHRAVFRDPMSWNLSDLLERIKGSEDVGKQAIDREYWRKMAVKFPQFPKTNEAIAMQIALYEEGATASTVEINPARI